MAAMLCAAAMNAKTLVAYYSYTNNVERIVNELCKQVDADVIEIEPAQKGLDYAANNYGPQMKGKNIGVIVSSASSGISGVVADAKRLIPEGNFLEPNLWIRSSQTSNAASLISSWLNDIHYNDLTSAVTAIAADNDFEIFVANGMISVNGESGTLALYNLSGNKVIETTERRVSTDALAPGIYIALATDAGHSVTRKINIR